MRLAHLAAGLLLAVLSGGLSSAPVVVTPKGVAGYMYIPASAAVGGAPSSVDSIIAGVSSLQTCTTAITTTKTFSIPAGRIEKDLTVRYFLAGGGGGGQSTTLHGGDGARVAGTFTIPAGYVGSYTVVVAGGGGCASSAECSGTWGEGGYGYYGGGAGGNAGTSGGCQPNARYGGGGGGGSTAIVQGTGASPGNIIGIAGGGGGSSGTGRGGGAMGGSGGAGGGGASGSHGGSGSDNRNGIWNLIAPTGAFGGTVPSTYTTATQACYGTYAYHTGTATGGINGGGGAGGGGRLYNHNTNCYDIGLSGGGGGGGAGGGGAGGGARHATTLTAAQAPGYGGSPGVAGADNVTVGTFASEGGGTFKGQGSRSLSGVFYPKKPGGASGRGGGCDIPSLGFSSPGADAASYPFTGVFYLPSNAGLGGGAVGSSGLGGNAGVAILSYQSTTCDIFF